MASPLSCRSTTVRSTAPPSSGTRRKDGPGTHTRRREVVPREGVAIGTRGRACVARPRSIHLVGHRWSRRHITMPQRLRDLTPLLTPTQGNIRGQWGPTSRAIPVYQAVERQWGTAGNAPIRLRKPLLYPPELQGHVSILRRRGRSDGLKGHQSLTRKHFANLRVVRTNHLDSPSSNFRTASSWIPGSRWSWKSYHARVALALPSGGPTAPAGARRGVCRSSWSPIDGYPALVAIRATP
jgi:hypothetical protein